MGNVDFGCVWPCAFVFLCLLIKCRKVMGFKRMWTLEVLNIMRFQHYMVHGEMQSYTTAELLDDLGPIS